MPLVICLDTWDYSLLKTTTLYYTLLNSQGDSRQSTDTIAFYKWDWPLTGLKLNEDCLLSSNIPTPLNLGCFAMPEALVSFCSCCNTHLRNQYMPCGSIQHITAILAFLVTWSFHHPPLLLLFLNHNKLLPFCGNTCLNHLRSINRGQYHGHYTVNIQFNILSQSKRNCYCCLQFLLHVSIVGTQSIGVNMA